MQPRRIAPVAGVLTALLLAAGCGEDKGKSCSDECTTLDELQCYGSVIEVCAEAEDGCLAWTLQTDCSETGELCDDSGNDPECVSACTDECPAADDTRCLGTIIQTCTTGTDGCLGWVDGTDCADTSEVCEESDTGAACATECSDECLPAGGTQCSVTTIQTCTEGTDGCTDWVDGTDCADSGQICDVSITGAACAYDCDDTCLPEGGTRCLDDVIQDCTAGTDGCTDWVDGTDCTTTDQFCSDVTGTAACVDACEDLCMPVGGTQCSGTVIQTCTVGTDGCTDWVDGTDCSSTSEACDDSSGTASCVAGCTDECTTSGDTQCSGTTIQFCGLDTDGCMYWFDVIDCTTLGYTCNDAVTGDAYCVAPCTSDCTTAGDTQCASDVVQTCTLDPWDGCLYWEDTVDCTTTAQECDIDPSSGAAACFAPAVILLLGDDVSTSNWDIYRAALTAAAVRWDEWNLDVTTAFPTPTDLAGYSVLIWIDEDTITPGDTQCQIVADWLALGGKSIFMTGIDFLWDFNSSTVGLGENNLYLRFATTYMGDYSGTTITSITGVTGDPVTGAFATTPLTLTMTSDSNGDYANETAGLAVKAGIYTGGTGSGLNHAAITHYDTGTYKTVWLGINFHNGLSDATQRATLMDNILTFFGL